MVRRVLAAGVLGLWVSFPGIALADVPPPDVCDAPGQACDTAPPDYQSPGVCIASMCTKAGPDGSFEVPCNLCKPDDGGGTGGSGTGGSGTGGSGTGGSGTGGSSSSSSSDDDGGCSFKGAPARGALALSLLALGLGALAFDRRRRR